MANVRALRSGIWHDADPTTSPWGSGGQVFFPTSVDNVWLNNFTVQLTANATVISITNESATSRTWVYGDTTTAASNGTLILADGVTFSGSVGGGVVSGNPSVTTIQFTSTSPTARATIIGNNFGSWLNVPCITNSSSGTLEIMAAAITNQSNSTVAIQNSNLGTLRIINATITSNQGNTRCIWNTAGGTIELINCNTNPANVGPGIVSSSGTIIATNCILNGGSASAGSALAPSNTNTFIRGGLVVGSATTHAVVTTSPLVISGLIMNAPNGVQAIYAPSYRIDPVPTNSFIRYARNGTGVGSDAWLYQFTTDSLSAFSMPPISAVRAGVQFANNTLTGTCIIPSPNSVAFGVPVDNTVGTAFLNGTDASVGLFNVPIASLTATDSLGARLKNSATVESIGKIIASTKY